MVKKLGVFYQCTIKEDNKCIFQCDHHTVVVFICYFINICLLMNIPYQRTEKMITYNVCSIQIKNI